MLVNHDSLFDEAVSLSTKAVDQGVTLRLLGGLAVRALCPSLPPRPHADIDFAAPGQEVVEVTRFFESLGYLPDEKFNSLFGHKQLYFVHRTSGLPVDVIVDVLEMCHTLDLSASFGVEGPTISPMDLLLSKLQIVEINPKDLRDIVCLLGSLPLTDSSNDGLARTRMRDIVSRDWGWWRTVTQNLDRVSDSRLLGDFNLTGILEHDPSHHAEALLEDCRRVPKTLKWRMRAKIGDRVRWYEEPEVDDHE